MKDEFGQLGSIATDPVLNAALGAQIPNSPSVNLEGNTDSSEETTKVATDTVYSQRFGWFAGCMQPVAVAFSNLMNKVTFSEKIKGTQSKFLGNI